jgi:hypothetical protein
MNVIRLSGGGCNLQRGDKNTSMDAMAYIRFFLDLFPGFLPYRRAQRAATHGSASYIVL